jgi:hypothetical protein
VETRNFLPRKRAVGCVKSPFAVVCLLTVVAGITGTVIKRDDIRRAVDQYMSNAAATSRPVPPLLVATTQADELSKPDPDRDVDLEILLAAKQPADQPEPEAPKPLPTKRELPPPPRPPDPDHKVRHKIAPQIQLEGAAAPKEINGVTVTRAAIIKDAVDLAAYDAHKNKLHAPFFRYIYCPDISLAPYMDVLLNLSLSRNASNVSSYRIQHPTAPSPAYGTVRLYDGVAIRVDIRDFASSWDDILEIAAAWELMALDEKDFLTNTTVIANHKVLVRQDKKKANKDDPQASFYEQVEIARRVPGIHAGIRGPALQQLTWSQVPIVRADFLIHKALTNVSGGTYYEFRGIVNPLKNAAILTAEDLINQAQTPKPNPPGPAKSKSGSQGEERELTDLEEWLIRVGADAALQFVLDDDGFLIIEDSISSEQKWGTFISGVTDRARGIVFLRSTKSRVTTNQGIIAITLDLDIETFDPEFHGVLTLAGQKFSGIEAFWEMPNGGIEFALFGGDGALARFAPNTLVSDRTTPRGPTILNPGMSCMRCHGAVGAWQPLPYNNSVQQFLSRYDTFGQVDHGFPFAEDINLNKALYEGDFSKLIFSANSDASYAVTSLTGVTEKSTQEAWGRLANAYNEYWYEPVTARTALLELGFNVPDDKSAVELWHVLLPDLPPDQLGIQPEDPRIGIFKIPGARIKRQDWREVKIDAAVRTINTLMHKSK